MHLDQCIAAYVIHYCVRRNLYYHAVYPDCFFSMIVISGIVCISYLNHLLQIWS